MERNIDRNLRMAKREARRFFGIRRGLARDGVYLIAILITFGGFYLAEPYIKHLQQFQDGLGWFLLIGMAVVVTAISFILKRVFNVHIWGRPRYKFPRDGRPNKPRYRRWPRGRTYADEAASWDNLHDRFEVKRINHQEAYSLDGASTNWAEEYFSRLRRAEVGIHHHIAGAYLLRYAQESSWREDNRRVSNGDQVSRVAALAMKRGKSVDFAGYWQRHVATSVQPFDRDDGRHYLGPFLGQLAAEQSLTSFANDPPFFAHVPAAHCPAVGLINLPGLA